MRYTELGWYVCERDEYIFHIDEIDREKRSYHMIIKYARYIPYAIMHGNQFYKGYKWRTDAVVRHDLKHITEEEVLTTRARWRLTP